jgi:Transposase DDE domain group 1
MEMKTLSDAEIKKTFGVEFFHSPNLSQFGGLQPFLSFLDKVQIFDRLRATCGREKASSLLQIMLGICVGAKSMEGISIACKDPVFKNFIKRPLVPTQIVRNLKNITALELAQLHELTVSLGILEFASTSFKGLPVTFDFDATAVEKHGSQEGVTAGYIGDDIIKPCYQYLFIRNDKLNSFVYGTVREGSTHSQNGFTEYLKMLLPLFNQEWTLRIRADAGYFNEEAFTLCSENNVAFYIKAPMSEARQRLANGDHLTWVNDEADTDVKYAIYQTRTKQGYIWREIFKRVKDKDSKDLLFPSYKTYCLATNEPDIKPSDAYEFYNKRARIENNIREMKNDYSLGKIVTESFAVNDAITQATIILYILIGHFKRNCFDSKDQRKTLETIRRQFFRIPARILTSARSEWTRLYTVLFDKLKWSRILSRIKVFTSILTIPLPVETS